MEEARMQKNYQESTRIIKQVYKHINALSRLNPFEQMYLDYFEIKITTTNNKKSIFDYQ